MNSNSNYRTRKLITDAMIELINEESLEQITIDKIAQRAHVNRSTFYRYYHSKYDVFDNILPNQIEEAFEGPWIEDRDLVLSLVKWTNTNRKMIRNMIGKDGSMTSFVELMHTVTNAINQKIAAKDGSLPPMLNRIVKANYPEIAVENFAVFIVQIVLVWSMHNELTSDNIDQYVDDVLLLLENKTK